jgi:hypothetical protein
LAANPPWRIGVHPFRNTNLDSSFARIGGHLKIAARPIRRTGSAGALSVDVRANRQGEFFENVLQAGPMRNVAFLD